MAGFLRGDSYVLAAGIDDEQEEIGVLGRCQLGVAPDHEIVYVTDVDVSGRVYSLRRGQEGTPPASWPAGTPFTWLRENSAYAAKQIVENLPRALSSSATSLNLRHAYRRMKVESEIMWIFHRGGRNGETLTVERGKEGTTAVDHAAGTSYSWLQAGAS